MDNDGAWLTKALAVGIPVSLVIWTVLIIAAHSLWRWLHMIHAIY